jgi:hypothetical protein
MKIEFVNLPSELNEHIYTFIQYQTARENYNRVIQELQHYLINFKCIYTHIKDYETKIIPNFLKLKKTNLYTFKNMFDEISSNYSSEKLYITHRIEDFVHQISLMNYFNKQFSSENFMVFIIREYAKNKSSHDFFYEYEDDHIYTDDDWNDFDLKCENIKHTLFEEYRTNNKHFLFKKWIISCQ